MRIYLSGPMSGYPDNNVPAFDAAAKILREQGFDVVSPAELDAQDNRPMTWGDLLARDVKIIADGGIEGIVFLPDWYKSRGARLEATIGLLQMNFKFFQYDGSVYPITRYNVAWKLFQEAIK